MNEEDIKLLEDNGWTVECESPFEVHHYDGSYATKYAAKLVLEDLRYENRVLKQQIFHFKHDEDIKGFYNFLQSKIDGGFKIDCVIPMNIESDYFIKSATVICSER